MAGGGGDVVARVLVVEDDASLSEIVCSYLRLHGYACTAAFSGTEACVALGLGADGGVARIAAPARVFDLVLCDLMLPGASGENVIARMRAAEGLCDVPVVVMSARDRVTDRVSLLRMGADDYLVKPFLLEELLARVEVQLRHVGRRARGSADEVFANACDGGAGGASDSCELSFGRWRARADSRSFTVDGASVKLTRTEFDIVLLLMRHPSRVFTRHELMTAVHIDGDLREDKTASTHVGNIRSKLKDTGTEWYIETVWGIGFKLTDKPL